MKDCCADRAQSIDLLQRRPAGFRVLTGEDAQYHNALIDGADGAILLSAHIETEAFAAVRTLLWEGNQDAAQRSWQGDRRTHAACCSPSRARRRQSTGWRRAG